MEAETSLPTKESVPARIALFLENHSVLTLSTHGDEGPWASPVFYVHDSDLQLYFLSNPGTRHGRNLQSNPRVAGAIVGSRVDWQEIRGIQLEGSVQQVGGQEKEHALSIYVKKFPAAAPFLDPGSPLYQKAGAQAKIYRLIPSRIGLTDNSRGFGHKDWLTFPL